jgi:RND family efflux transporter MFP subunit
MKLPKVAAPLILAIASVVIVTSILNNPPEAARKRGNKVQGIAVELVKIQAQSFQVSLQSYGTVRPRTESNLVAQAGGQITYISEQLRDGGFFSQGDVLLQVDERDYQANIRVAESALIFSRQALAEEQARSRQAKKDWDRLGKSEHPEDLVLRIPQMETAKAGIIAAEADLIKAQLALERTRITAPYTGRVRRKSVDVGQVVSANTSVAEIYASDYVEVRLPIKNRDLALIDLPEHQRGETQVDAIPVFFTSDLIGQQTWQGKIVRTESVIDSNSQQLYVLALIDQPFGQANTSTAPIKMGQYVSATIDGRKLDAAILIPNHTIYQGSYVYVEQEGVINRREIETLWQDDTQTIVASGLKEGDKLVLTPLGLVSSGTAVTVVKPAGSRS